MPNILVNALPLLDPLTGVGNYTRGVLEGAVSQGSDLHLSLYKGCRPVPASDAMQRTATAKAGGAALVLGALRRFPPVQVLWKPIKSHIALTQHYHLYFEPNYIPMSEVRSVKTVVTVHDFSWLRHPEWHPHRRIKRFQRHFWKGLSRADCIITGSRFVAAEARDCLAGMSIPTVPIYYGLDHSRFCPSSCQGELESLRSRYRLAGDYYLFVGTRDPRKNVSGLIAGYSRLPAKVRRRHQLVLVGSRGWENTTMVRALAQLGAQVVSLGYVEDAHLPALYRGALAFVFPSLYEGLGLPLLEAMASGCPVIASNRSGMPEACGQAARYIDPEDVGDLSAAMCELAEDEGLRSRLRTLGLQRAKLFSWQKCAREHLEVFRKVLDA